MRTIKLYDENARLSRFTATVVSCERTKNGYALILDKTAFFPEEGGQPCDTGTVNGVQVTGVSEKQGVIIHTVQSMFNPGQTVEGTVDFDRRFDFMQNHSGEHIVSGIVHKKYGFDNVGFHLNECFATVDFSGILTRQMLDEVENAANRAVFENRKIRAFYPTQKELETLEYRSKKEINGDVRIVDIDGVDVCACCAPHVSRTGEIGVIKLLDSSKMRGGTRVVLKCGRYALLDYRNKYKNISEISAMLSAKQENAAYAVENLLKKEDNIKQYNNELVKRLIQNTVALFPDKSFFYESDYDMKQLQLLADGLHKTYGGIKAAFSGEGGKYFFAFCGEEEALKVLFSDFKSVFSVVGGGRKGMVQGTVLAPLDKIESFLTERI